MPKKLESIRMLSIVIHAMIGIELITMPSNAVKYAKNDAWLCTIIVGILIFINAQEGFWICKNYPGLNFAEINEKLYGKVIGKILILTNIIYNIYINGVSLRLFSESINLFLLEKTPIVIIMAVILSIMFYCMIMDLETISIVFDILLPLVLFFIVILLIISFTAATPYNLYPPLYRGALPILKGAINSFNPAAAAFIFAFILPMFAKPMETKKFVNLGIMISTLIYTSIILLCIMVFGAAEINYLVFPTLTLSKAIELQSPIFERTESLFMAAWIPNTFTTLVVYYMISSISAKALFNTKKDTLVKFAQLPLILAIALIPKNKVDIFKMLDWANIGILFLAFGYLPMIALTVLFKKGRGKNAT